VLAGVEMLNGRVAGWTERGNSVLHELTCAQLADSVRSENVQLQQPFDVTGTWISTRYDINAGAAKSVIPPKVIREDTLVRRKRIRGME